MTTPVEYRGYAHGDVLVSTDWVAAHLRDPSVPHHRIQRGHAPVCVRAHPGRVQVD